MSNAISYRLWPLSWPLPWGWVKKLGKLKRCISWTHFQKHSTKDTLISQIQIRNKSQNRSLKVVGHMVEAFRKIFEFLWFMCPCGLWMLCNGPVLIYSTLHTSAYMLCEVYFEKMKGVECLMTRNLSLSNARWSVCSLCLSMNNAPPSPKAHPLTRISPHAARPTIVYYPNKATPCFNTKHRSNPRSVDN